MMTLHNVEALRHQVAVWRQSGERVALVPTMGNLHEGHLQLVERAGELTERVVVSIFVNPLQFGAGEDFDAYPRTLDADREKLEPLNVDAVFAPSVAIMYPRPQAEQTRVEVPGVSDILCGASRPGHFVGVATVVCKLFNQVGPDVALFGEKDFQQLMVIRRMVEDLDMPIRIVGHPTIRGADGLALSSRNVYLNTDERQRAPALYSSLQWVKSELERGRRDHAAIEQEARRKLDDSGLRSDYLSIRRADDLAPASDEDADLVVLAAAFLGKARLIDNLRVLL